VLHPDKIFDMGLRDEGKREARAIHYGITVEGYKRQDLLRAEVTADCAMTGPLFGCTNGTQTGVQVPVDGGGPRVG
jgi:hypothetical protein